MKNSRFSSIALPVLLLTLSLGQASAAGEEDKAGYGSNPDRGGFVAINDIQMYYEVYGEGEPLALIHGSGQDIAAMRHQIDYFASKYTVVVADSRAHGKSGLGEGDLTYVKMADDWADLFRHLELKSVKVVGWSDGGNIGLRMAVDHPDVIGKLATMGSNLQPDESAVQPWAVAWVKEASAEVDAMLAAGDTSQDWKVQAEHLRLLREQPNMSLEELAKIQVPVLVMAGDKDVIRDEHTVLMYQNISQAHLAIFPGETHFTPETDPDLFNRTVDKFMSNPYSRPTTKEIMLGEH